MGRIIISKEDAAAIKKLLWSGNSLASIALTYDVTPAAISYISTGARHTDVKWPDGSDGPMPQARVMLLRRQRDAARTNREILQKRVQREQAKAAKPKEYLNLLETLAYFDATYPDEPVEITRHMKEKILPGLNEVHKGMTSTANIDKVLLAERRYYEMGVGAYERQASKKKNRRH